MNRNGEDYINTFFYLTLPVDLSRGVSKSALPETAFIAIFQPTVSLGQVLLVR